jgi:SAM-dependent methyltransferase
LVPPVCLVVVCWRYALDAVLLIPLMPSMTASLLVAAPLRDLDRLPRHSMWDRKPPTAGRQHAAPVLLPIYHAADSAPPIPGRRHYPPASEWVDQREIRQRRIARILLCCPAMGVDSRLVAAAESYERAMFGGDTGGLAAADRGLDGVAADLALARGRLLHARFLAEREEDPRQLELVSEAAELYRALGDGRGEAEALLWVGIAHQVVRGDNERAVPALTRSYALAKAAGDALTMSYAVRHLGFADAAEQRLDRAWERQEESLRLRREVGFQPGVAAALLALAEVAHARGGSAQARALLDQACETAARSGAHGTQRWIAAVRAELDPEHGKARYDPGYEAFAGLYDTLNPWGASDDFYLGYVMAAGSALDVGCGTGGLLCRAREAGHAGELVGADPAEGMLAVARGKRDDVEWVRGDARTLELGRRFELITMTGHAFQELLDDTDIRTTLASFRRHLLPGGRLVFETRNPAVRAWERWTPEATRTRVTGPDGEEFEVANAVRGERPPDLVDFDGTVRSLRTGTVVSDTGTLRFIEPGRLRELLTEAGFHIEDWYGNWDRATTGPELIVVAGGPHQR